MKEATIDQEVLVERVASLEDVALLTEEVEEEDDKGQEEGTKTLCTEKFKSETGGSLFVENDREDDVTEVANEELARTEEVNRKFEEFIRKMKEELIKD